MVRRAAFRRLHPGAWSVPGGHLEPGETPAQALERELREEIGVSATAYRPMGRLPGAEGALFHLFEVEDWRGTPRLRGDEHSALRWVALGEVARRGGLAPDGLGAALATRG